MASSSYDLPLDEIVKNRNRKRTNTNRFTSSENFRKKLQKRNFNGRISYRDRATKNQGNVILKNNSRQNISRVQSQRSNINKATNRRPNFTKGNLNNKLILSKNSKKNEIIKTGIQTANANGPNKSIRLFTKHFDARAKIKPKKTSNSKINPFGELAKRALVDVCGSPTDNNSNPKKRPANPSFVKNSKENSFRNSRNKQLVLNTRESLFTGKSIKVVTKNDLSAKEKKTLLKGNNSTPARFSTKQNKQTIPTTIQRYEEGPDEQPVRKKASYQGRFDSVETTNMLSPVKKSIPAKVIISNLHENVTQEDIQELFGAIGDLQEARLTSAGTAECVYSTAEDAFAAYTKYQSRNLDGQPMVLKITTVDSPKPIPKINSRSGGRRTPPSYSSTRTTPQSTFLSGGVRASANNSAGGTSKPVVFTVKL